MAARSLMAGSGDRSWPCWALLRCCLPSESYSSLVPTSSVEPDSDVLYQSPRQCACVGAGVFTPSMGGSILLAILTYFIMSTEANKAIVLRLMETATMKTLLANESASRIGPATGRAHAPGQG